MTGAPIATSDVGILPSAQPADPIRSDSPLWLSPSADAPDLTTGNSGNAAEGGIGVWKRERKGMPPTRLRADHGSKVTRAGGLPPGFGRPWVGTRSCVRMDAAAMAALGSGQGSGEEGIGRGEG